MTLILLNALLPIFVGLLLGYIAGRRGVMDNLNVRNLIVLVMDFAIPCALFSTISSTSWPVLREQSESAVMIAVVFVALYAASYIWARKSLKMSIKRCGNSGSFPRRENGTAISSRIRNGCHRRS